MERTDEFRSAAQVFEPVDKPCDPPQERGLSGVTVDCKRVLTDIKINEDILHKINKLASFREYSNDPTNDISAQSEAFQRQVVVIQSALDKLKRQISQFKSNSARGKHHQLHFEIILEVLQKQVAVQASTFQETMKRHFEHVQQRQQRVVKYGQVEATSVATPAPGSGGSKNYAMFSGNKLTRPPAVSAGPSSELRRRVPAGSASSSNSGGGHSNSSGNSRFGPNSSGFEEQSSRTAFGPENGVPYQINAQEIRKNAVNRMQNAESVEKIVAQMGGLFSQMASLIVEQGETITRIEDDVELGHQQTTEAQESMEYFYEITKGNRSMIFKIFGLLIFFIFIFLVWLR